MTAAEKTGKNARKKVEEKKAAGQENPLSPEMAAALAAFERHLRAERSLSPHTVRAYLGDVSSLLEHAHQAGVQAPEGLQATHLRSWLASQHASGAARTTLARRGAAARTFTAFAHRRGWLATDPGPQLGTLKTRRTLPHVLRQDEMRTVLDTANRAAEAGTPQADKAVALRDAAVLELLYATGIRVSELCGLTADSFDHARRTVRVRGKGDKERTVPVGMPALRAVSAWLDQGRPALATASSGAALFLGARGGRLDPRTARRIVHQRLREGGSDPRYGPARPTPQRGHPPARGRRRPPQRAGDPRPLLARDHPDLHTRVHRAPQVQLPPGSSPRLHPAPSRSTRRPPTPLSPPKPLNGMKLGSHRVVTR